MGQLLSREFRIAQAEVFRDSIANTSANTLHVYTAIGRQIDWPSTPPTPNNSVQYTQFDLWRQTIALKKVQASDVSLAIPRKDWATGTVYQAYSNETTDLYATDFYVYTDDSNVYKCLYNNKGAQSTVKPTGTTTSLVYTSDGYIWKFMYAVAPASASKFETTAFIPVETLTANNGSAQWVVQQAAANSSIEVATLNAGGSGYVEVVNTFLTVTNSTVVELQLSASGVDNLYNGSTIYIKNGLGSGQLREIIDYTGSGRVVVVNSAFTTTPNTLSSFIISPKVTITGDGTGYEAYCNVASSGAVNYINVISPGTGFSTATLTISANVGSGASANAVISPVGGHGSDPVSELGGHNLIINTKLIADESNTINTLNDYHVFGLIKNPLLTGGDNLAIATNYDTTIKLNISSVSAPMFASYIDEQVVGQTSGATGEVVYIANTNSSNTEGVMHINNLNDRFIDGEAIASNTSGITAQVDLVEYPTVRQFTGDVLFVETRSSVQRNPAQTEDIKFVIKY